MPQPKIKIKSPVDMVSKPCFMAVSAGSNAMAIVCGILSIIMGCIGLAASMVRAGKNQRLESHEEEMAAIGWFILAALCLR